MKVAGQILLLTVLLAVGRVWAGDLALSENPYAPLVQRNIFGLVPIPAVDPSASLPPADPPPKITPNGIMSIFGKLQVLFKVPSKPKPGQPPKEESYMLSEGERQDDIEVVKIDEAASLVTFNNHGTVQELALANAPNISAPAGSGGAGAAGGVPGSPGFSSPSFGRSRPVAPGSMPSPGSSPSAATGFNNGRGQENISPEAQVIMIEAQRAQWKAANNPAHMILPPTPLTQQLEQEEAGGGGPPMPQ